MSGDAIDVMPCIAKVALDEGLTKLLDYQIVKEHQGLIRVGSRVIVPVRGMKRRATVVSLHPTSVYPKLASIDSILDEHVLEGPLYKLAQWMSEYYATPLPKVLKLFIPSAVREGVGFKTQFYVKSILSKEALRQVCETLRQRKKSQAKILDYILLTEDLGDFLQQVLKKSQTSRAAVDELVNQGVLSCEKITISRFLDSCEYFPSKPKELSAEQLNAYHQMTSSIEKNMYQTHLLHGVTGSGKTEVYLQAISKVRSLNKSAIVLVPEVALTSQMIESFKSRLQEPIGVYHYRLSQGEKYDLWKGLASGKISVLLGARSAIFMPMKNLGLIIVDEEHETSYKETEKSPSYHGRDVAVMRGFLEKATLVLGSATPSFESYQNALSGKYVLHTLKERALQSKMPQVHLVDMKKENEKKQFLFSSSLLEALSKKIKLGEQTLLFLNRRGYYSQLTCKACHTVTFCPSCSVALIFHKKKNVLMCHYCDYTLSPPSRCLSCQSDHLMVYKGFGTEQVEHQLKKIFPEISILRMDADTTSKKGSHEAIYKAFRAGKADVLIGTQMVAKGLHFPQVTLVGILDADQSLHIPDFRAPEHLFQLLVQVCGRAGRTGLSSDVIIQTYSPHHFLYDFIKKGDFRTFFDKEIEGRRLFNYPPFSHLARCLFSGPDQHEVKLIGESFKEKLENLTTKGITVYPLVPDRIEKKENCYRFSLLIKGPSMSDISKKIYLLSNSISLKLNYKIHIDVNF